MHSAAVGAFVPLAKTAVQVGAQGASAAARATATKAQEVAKEFESLLMGQMLKQSRETLDKDGGFFANDKGDNYGALFDFFLGKHLADNGGVGLADYLKRQMTANQPK